MKKRLKIFLGSDHAGFELKDEVKKYLDKNKIDYYDFGAFSKEDVDYPDFIFPVAEKVAENKNYRGIVFGGSGQGEAIVANRVNGIRAVVVYSFDREIVELSREHNNSNVLSLGARFLKRKEAVEIVKLWLKTDFSKAERHKRRIKKIEKYEK